MKKFQTIFVMVLIGLFLISSLGFAQLKTPQVSLYSSVTQQIGLTDVTIQYHRPGVKDRESWGKLVPYGLVPPGPASLTGNHMQTISTSCQKFVLQLYRINF